MVYYPVFRSQRGHGIGFFLQNFVKKGVSHLGKRALVMGGNVLDKTSKGVPLKTALKIKQKK